MTTANQPGADSAFPWAYGDGGWGTGMTYRQWLVGQALAGLLAAQKPKKTIYGNLGFQTLADAAVEAADAVLRRLESDAAEACVTRDELERGARGEEEGQPR